MSTTPHTKLTHVAHHSAAARPGARNLDQQFAAVVHDALAHLRQKKRLAGAETWIPASGGLYAIYGSAEVWLALSLGEPPDDRPLYVGKAEDSLFGRDLRTHFGDGRTGQSTVRRSVAALLHDTLQLQGLPRNPARPGYFSSYGPSPKHDAVLTAWMRERLEIAVWPKPDVCSFSLKTIETALLARLLPPLNLQDVVTPWTAQVRAARALMAAEARRWTE
jgi:hypothetical protein